jgi:hypothetical protein
MLINLAIISDRYFGSGKIARFSACRLLAIYFS